MFKVLRVKIEDIVSENSTAAETYLETLSLLYKRGFINDSILEDFNFIKNASGAFNPSEVKAGPSLIAGTKNLWVSTYTGTQLKYERLLKIF